MDLKHQAAHLRAEQAEKRALLSLYQSASPALRAKLGFEVHAVADATVFLASKAPHFAVNRTIGLGQIGAAQQADVDAVVNLYRRAGIEHFFFHLDPHAQPADLPTWMNRAGLDRYHRGWTKFQRPGELAPKAPSAPSMRRKTDLEIRKVDATHGADFARIACEAFELDPQWIEAVAALTSHPAWQIFMSFDGDEPAGCGALLIDADTAWFDWGATRPEYRCRGSQSALMAARIDAAVAAGCTLLATCTGEAVPGDPQHSYRNIERAGFQATHIRQNWVPVC